MITLYNVRAVPWGCVVPWGCLVSWGNIMDVEGYLEYCGDIMSTMGVILSTVEDTQYRRDIMMQVGDIMSTVRGCSVQWGRKSFVILVP